MDWLNEITNDSFRFFGLEIELWRIGDSPAAPKFNIVAKPNEWTRSVGQATRGGSVNQTAANLQHRRFWDLLNAHLQAKDSPVQLNLQSRQYRDSRNYIRTNIRESTFLLEGVRVGKSNIHIKMTLVGSSHSDTLAWLQQQDIQGDLPESLRWEQLAQTSRIILRNDVADSTDESDWPNQVEWMADGLERFARVFPPLIQELADGE